MLNRHREKIVHSLADSMMDRTQKKQPDELYDIVNNYFGDLNSWKIKKQFPWIHLLPNNFKLPNQGWKIHISATRFSAIDVLTAVLPILLEEKVQFKLAFSIQTLVTMNESHYPRGNSGKFITVYSVDETQFKRVTKRCHDVTKAMDGPRILSDKPFQQNSLVHYRYGGFKKMEVLRPDGDIMYVIYGPNNKAIEDIRYPYYNPPSWVEEPFQEPDNIHRNFKKELKIRLNNRYLISEAIRHANKGGIYIGFDIERNNKVIIKEARPHVGTDRNGNDARHYLTNEYNKLKVLSKFKIVPQALDLFTQGDNTYLVQEYLEGTTLRSFVKGKEKEGTLSKYQNNLVGNLLTNLDIFHENNIIIRDFNPNNVMVINETAMCKNFDLEYSFDMTNVEFSAIKTPGYTSPQQISGKIPTFSDDIYSLGATIYFIFTGRDPFFLDDDMNKKSGRSYYQKIVENIELLTKYDELSPEIADMIKNILKEDPNSRLGIEEIRNIITNTKE